MPCASMAYVKLSFALRAWAWPRSSANSSTPCVGSKRCLPKKDRNNRSITYGTNPVTLGQRCQFGKVKYMFFLFLFFQCVCHISITQRYRNEGLTADRSDHNFSFDFYWKTALNMFHRYRSSGWGAGGVEENLPRPIFRTKWPSRIIKILKKINILIKNTWSKQKIWIKFIYLQFKIITGNKTISDRELLAAFQAQLYYKLATCKSDAKVVGSLASSYTGAHTVWQGVRSHCRIFRLGVNFQLYLGHSVAFLRPASVPWSGEIVWISGHEPSGVPWHTLHMACMGDAACV